MRRENHRINETGRILIICNNREETILLLFPAIRQIRDRNKSSKFDILCPPGTEMILKETGWFEKIIVHHRILFFKMCKNLWKEKYKLVISFQPSLLPYLTRSQRKLIFFPRKLFSDRFFTHESVNYMKLIEPYFGKWQDKELCFPITDNDRQKAKSFLLSNGITSSNTLVAIHPGNPGMPDRWNSANYAKVCDTIIEEYNARIFLFGELNDPMINEIISISKYSDKILNMSKINNPREIVSLIERTNLAITRDGVFLYLACAAKIPVVSIFGAGNPYRYGPLGTKYINVHTDMECFPCNRKRKCRKNYQCINTIRYENVIESARLILDECKQLFLFE